MYIKNQRKFDHTTIIYSNNVTVHSTTRGVPRNLEKGEVMSKFVVTPTVLHAGYYSVKRPPHVLMVQSNRMTQKGSL